MKKKKVKTEAVEEEMRVRKIENGTVIDHIPAGNAMNVLKILGLDEEFPGTVTIAMRVPSSKHGAKDVVKIEGKTLAKKELQKLALTAPYGTVNQIKNYRVVEKFRITTPEQFDDVVACPNPHCITNNEGTSLLKTIEKDPLKVRCAYCERIFAANELTY